MAGDWTSDDLAGVLTVVRRPDGDADPAAAAAAAAAAACTPGRRAQDNTVDGSRENIHRHYDLSNDLFAAVPGPDDDLLVGAVRGSTRRPTAPERPAAAAAQHRKIDRLLDLAGVGRGHHGAGDRHRLGRAGASGPPQRGAHGHHGDHLDRAAELADQADRRGRADRPGRRSSCRTTARSQGSSTPWSASR